MGLFEFLDQMPPGAGKTLPAFLWLFIALGLASPLRSGGLMLFTGGAAFSVALILILVGRTSKRARFVLWGGIALGGVALVALVWLDPSHLRRAVP